jgi:hypothetical protein
MEAKLELLVGTIVLKATTVRPIVKLILEILDLKEDPAAARKLLKAKRKNKFHG